MKRFISKAATAIVFLTAAIHGAICSSAATYTADYDVDGNGKIEVADIVTLNHFLAEDAQFFTGNEIAVFDLNGDGMTTVEDSLCLINYMMNNELFPSTTTTTDPAITTTTTSTTSTSPTQTTTIDTTTVSAGTTTTSTTNTTNTTTSTTSTSKTTTTSATTTSTSTTPSLSEVRETANEYMAQLLREASEGIEIPPLNDTSYRQGSGVFFAKYGSKVFAFTMLTKNPDAPEFFDTNDLYIDAIHCWEYTKGDIDFSLPDTSEAFFLNEDGDECSYSLKETLRNGEIGFYIYDYVNSQITGSEIELGTIAHIDYNLDGQISPEDLKETFKRHDLIDFKRFYTEWISFFTNLWEGTDILDGELVTSRWNTANFVLEYSSDYTDYSLVCPVSSDGSFSGLTQVLPINLYDSMLEEFGDPWFEHSDEDDCIFFDSCDSAYDGMLPCWTTANSSTVQYMHIKLIDENGDYISHRLDNYGN